jgi:hypothetical protein
MVIGFMGGIVVQCHRTRARLFERSSRDKKQSPLLDDDAFRPFQGKGVDSEFMPVEFEDVEFRDVAETVRHL